MTTSGFWTAAPTVDPARQFRFRVLINDQFAWWAKTCDKPKINIPVLGKDEYYLGSALPDTKPGEIIDLQPITMTFIDPVEPSMAKSILTHLRGASGDCFPRINPSSLKGEFSPSGVVIQQVNEQGVAIETWILNGAFPTSIDFGSLDYGSDDFTVITMTWEYISFNAYAGGTEIIIPQAPNTEPDIIKLDGGFI